MPALESALPWIKTVGQSLQDSAGNTVNLRGVGLGGWMNMENFITGYPGNELEMRKKLRQAMKPGAYDAFFEAFYVDFFDEADAAHIASLGLNSVRIPVNYRHFEDDAKPFTLLEAGFERLDRVIDLLAAKGIYSIIDLHAVPGCQNQHWHSDNPTHRALFWDHPHFQDRVVHLWEAFADRYKDRPEVAGYNPINEPADKSGTVLPALYRRLEETIRQIDPRTTLFLDGNKYSTDFSCFDPAEPFDNVVYSTHDYALPGITSATEYPGVTRGEFFDKEVIEASFLRRTEFSRESNTPIWIGEFGPMYPGQGHGEEWRYQLLQDQLDIYSKYDAGWALWTYKDIGLQGLAYTSPSSEYMRLIEPVLDQKGRLGADSWGGSDVEIRSVLDPIDEVFANEFPSYDPYPWGIRQHVNVLVRHILLAEPIAEEYAKLLGALNEEQARSLARSFRFENCELRSPLASMLTKYV